MVSDGNGGSKFCPETPKWICDSKFKFCALHKKGHGTRGKQGHIHTFKRCKTNGGK